MVGERRVMKKYIVVAFIFFIFVVILFARNSFSTSSQSDGCNNSHNHHTYNGVYEEGSNPHRHTPNDGLHGGQYCPYAESSITPRLCGFNESCTSYTHYHNRPKPTVEPTEISLPTSIIINTPTVTPTSKPKPIIIVVPTKTNTPTPTIISTSTATPTKTNTPKPTLTPTRTLIPISTTNIPTNIPTVTPTNIPTLTPTSTPTSKPKPTLTPTHTSIPTSTPTEIPTVTPTNTPTLTPTLTPTPRPTSTPTETPKRETHKNYDCAYCGLHILTPSPTITSIAESIPVILPDTGGFTIGIGYILVFAFGVIFLGVIIILANYFYRLGANDDYWEKRRKK